MAGIDTLRIRAESAERELAGARKMLQNEHNDVGVLAVVCDKALNDRDTLLSACEAVLRMIQSHQIYDKDARSVLERAIESTKDAK